MEFTVEQLRECPFFSQFKDNELLQILSKLKKQELADGEYLLKEKEPGNCLYILVKGKLIVTTLDKNEEKIVAYIRPGEVVGELSIFSNEPRSASVKSLYPSVVMRLEREDFKAISFENPSILWDTSTVIAARAQSNIALIRSEKKSRNQIISLISLDPNTDPKKLYQELKAQNKYKLDFVDSVKNKTHYEVSALLNQSIKKGNSVIYPIHFEDVRSNLETIELSDRVIVVVDTDKYDRQTFEKIWADEVGIVLQQMDKELVLLHATSKTWYPGTEDYLRLAKFSRCHHVCYEAPVTLQRLLRFLTGNCLGLVLSGGGAKGWALVGAVRALFERKVEIDYVGGTSIGVLVAAAYAMNPNFEGFNAVFKKLAAESTANPFSFKNLTWPLVSIFNGKNETAKLKEICKEAKISDLTIPFFAISTNISAYGQYIWDHEYLWQACRASMAIPALLPPVAFNHQIHVDGALINNFPVDVMNDKLDKQGYIIGINISETDVDLSHYNFPPHLSFWDAIKMAFEIWGEKIKYLKISEIMERIIMTASIDKTFRNEKLCDFLIKPKLQGFKFSDFLRRKELMEAGYIETKKLLENWNPPN